jgi:hypothetical protein
MSEVPLYPSEPPYASTALPTAGSMDGPIPGHSRNSCVARGRLVVPPGIAKVDSLPPCIIVMLALYTHYNYVGPLHVRTRYHDTQNVEVLK